MNIAIVDDRKIELETAEIFLRVYIKKFWTKYESLIHIDTFYSAEDFLRFFCPKIYQLIILGRNMNNIAEKLCADGDSVKVLFLKDGNEVES